MSEEPVRRRTSARTFRTRVALAAAVVVLLVVGAVWALFFSSWFTVDDVQVRGVSVLSAEDVLDAAAVRPGAPLVRLDADGVSERVAELAPVDEVSVTRQWPHTVVITVTERQPVLAVPSDQGFAIYDDDGVAYLESITVPDGVAQITTENPDDLVIRDVITVLADVPDAVRSRLVGVRAETADSIELDLTDGVVVVWGSAEEGPRKAQVLTALMKQPGRVYIVSAPDAPAIRE